MFKKIAHDTAAFFKAPTDSQSAAAGHSSVATRFSTAKRRIVASMSSKSASPDELIEARKARLDAYEKDITALRR